MKFNHKNCPYFLVCHFESVKILDCSATAFTQVNIASSETRKPPLLAYAFFPQSLSFSFWTVSCTVNKCKYALMSYLIIVIFHSFHKRCVSYSILYQPDPSRHSSLLPGTCHRPKPPSGSHRCVESYSPLPRRCGACFSGRMPSDLHVLQHDHCLVFLLSICVVSSPPPLLYLPQRRELHSKWGVQTGRSNTIFLVH